MMIRRAKQSDIPAISGLLRQVCNVHHHGRPDLFQPDGTKYTAEQLADLIADDSRPIFVAVDSNEVTGYAFCMFKQHLNDTCVTDIRTLYIDDLCVDENRRGQHIGRQLYEYVLQFAKESGCYNVTLNVWCCNPGAMQFYERCGLVPQKIGMEKIL
ncbi:MAG: GNAT family N-acetyltransferase [Clostridia bacterium]|nr:GNAT family N-acetyltransferase [Clostridia bacterium]